MVPESVRVLKVPCNWPQFKKWKIGFTDRAEREDRKGHIRMISGGFLEFTTCTLGPSTRGPARLVRPVRGGGRVGSRRRWAW